MSGKTDKLGKCLRKLPPHPPWAFQDVEGDHEVFGSVYLCEKLFSTMNFNKSRYGSKLTDEHLQTILWVSTASCFLLQASVDQVCERKCCQVFVSKGVIKRSLCSEESIQVQRLLMLMMKIEKIGSVLLFLEYLKTFFLLNTWKSPASPTLYLQRPPGKWS